MFHSATCINTSGQKINSKSGDLICTLRSWSWLIVIYQTVRESVCVIHFYSRTSWSHCVVLSVFMFLTSSWVSKGQHMRQYYTDLCSVLIAQSLIHNSDIFPFCRWVCGFQNKTSFSSTQCAQNWFYSIFYHIYVIYTYVLSL